MQTFSFLFVLKATYVLDVAAQLLKGMGGAFGSLLYKYNN